MKECRACKIEKPLDDFHRDKKVKKDGRVAVCRSCASLKQREYRRKNLANYREAEDRNKLRRVKELRARLFTYLEGKSCVDCGYNAHVAPMQFDHVRGTKFRDVGAMVSGAYSWSRILEEIGKCDLVCANCHSIRTARQFGWYAGFESS